METIKNNETKKLGGINGKYQRMLNENLTIDKEKFLNEVKEKLKKAFPDIPKDLTNQSTSIKLKGEFGTYFEISVYGDSISITNKKLSEQTITIISKNVGMTLSLQKKHINRNININEINQQINNIITNKEKCEINVWEKSATTKLFEEIRKRMANKKQEKIDEETITDEKIMKMLTEEEKQEYQRLKGIIDLANALGKDVPEDVKKELEQYEKKAE